MWTSEVAMRIPPPYERMSERANLGKAAKMRKAGRRPKRRDPPKINPTDTTFATRTADISTYSTLNPFPSFLSPTN
jgi:hypothetical protein